MSATTLRDCLDAARASYLTALRRAIADAQVDGAHVLVEGSPGFRTPEGEPMPWPEDELGPPYRFDMVIPAEDGSAESRIIDVKPSSGGRFEEGGVVVAIAQLSWNLVMVRATPLALDAAAAPVRAWYDRWFHAPIEVDEPFVGAVHFLGALAADGDTVTFQVDLGTVPVDAVVELRDLLAGLGATAIDLDRPPDEVAADVTAPE